MWLIKAVRILKVLGLKLSAEILIQFSDHFVEGKRMSGSAIVNLTVGRGGGELLAVRLQAARSRAGGDC